MNPILSEKEMKLETLRVALQEANHARDMLVKNKEAAKRTIDKALETLRKFTAESKEYQAKVACLQQTTSYLSQIEDEYSQDCISEIQTLFEDKEEVEIEAEIAANILEAACKRGVLYEKKLARAETKALELRRRLCDES
ncbi:hypothetical protein BDQ12DRAFT_355613 [Crucibulum laeve]|uniref:Uncharacterized protein n=1 Tax=Crucibulum laeve TaxID=68775 RepID=A0A5C3ME97_9AGAR|nr:hypothetical protein BDQ12DRAFT_355613 [Crucibulum laeve]